MKLHAPNSIPITSRHPKANATRFIGHFLTALLLCTTASLSAPALSESQVFEWWDNGIVDADEAREILDLLEENNEQEACILAEVYALESCPAEISIPPEAPPAKAKATKKSPKKSTRPSLVPHGYAEWRGRTDSLGHIESGRDEIRIQFYRYSLRLGSQALLTYKNAGSEAHFGQISTGELHSAIPLDTLRGTSLRYPFGSFLAGALIDTAKTTRLNLGFNPSQEFQLELAYWHHQADSIERHSVSAQAKGNWGSFSAWWVPENKGELPLIKLQLHHREKSAHYSFSWKADAYAHGTSLPQESHLTPSIEKSRFWGSQTLSASIPEALKSTFTLNARTIIPLDADTSKTRFKANIESGPSLLRGTASVTCLSAEERCQQNDFTFKIQSAWDILLSGKFRARHTRGKGFNSPLYEASATYALDDFNSASVAITIPKGSPTQELLLRSSTEVGIDHLQLSLSVTFRHTAEQPMYPQHAAMKARILF